MASVTIGDRQISLATPTYFIAEIGANHDGDLQRAKDLIWLAKESGAEAAKFQHFTAEKLVSAHGFAQRTPAAHQASWKKSVTEVYRDAETPHDWTPVLKQTCDEAGMHFFSSPYDLAAVDHLDPYVPAFKIGSGDIEWLEELAHAASKGKPVLLGTGAADLPTVERAVNAVLAVNPALVLMQCNTNYTGSLDNFRHAHLRVLTTFAQLWPELVLGLSDHTPGCATTLGAVTLGARVVEKHFTDDPSRPGNDHGFAMANSAFKEMVDRTRELEAALGGTRKVIADNERETLPLQRRCLRAARPIAAGETLTREMIDVLRPLDDHAIHPHDLPKVLGQKVLKDMEAGQVLTWAGIA